MIQLYKKGNNNFSNNGDLVIQPTSSKGKFATNNEITYEFEYPYDEEGRWKEISIDDVIAAPTFWSGKQLFRIYNIVKDVNSMTIYTRHIFFDLNNYVLLDVRPTNLIGEDALNYILKDTPYTGKSNINIASTSYYVRKNIIEAINGNDENSFINRWGGEILPDNFIVNINNQLGGDYGVNITLGKNLKSIEEDVNLDDVVTRIIPEGYDGIMLDGDTPWIDSPLINNYSQVRMKVVKFDDIKVKSNENDEEGYDTLSQAQTAMIERCNTLFEGGLDKPTVNYKVEMYLLRDTEEYKDFAILEDVSIGDTVHCKHEGIGIECDARCISLEWHIENGDKIVYDTIELGTPEQNFFESTNDISNKVSNILNKAGNVKGDCLQGLIDASKASIQASKKVAELQDYRVGMCQDLDPNSDTYGATMWGSTGFFCADKRTLDNKDWNWSTAITGKGIVADAIKTGILSAVKIINKDGSFLIDLSKNGGIEFNDTTSGTPKKALEIKGTDINFFSANGVDTIGKITGYTDTNKNKVIQIQHTANGYFEIAPESSVPYATFDEYGKRIVPGEFNAKIMIWRNIKLTNICVTGNLHFGYDLEAYIKRLYDGSEEKGLLISSSKGVSIQSATGIGLVGNVNVIGDLNTSGSKHRAVDTENYGTRLLNAYETAECYFGDIGKSTTGEECKVKINLDPIFLETVDTSIDYHVFLSKYGRGDIWVSELHEDYFVVESENPNLKFSYEIKAKQIDYATTRLEEFKNSSMDISERRI